MTAKEYLILTNKINILKEAQREYHGLTIENIIQQMESVKNETAKEWGEILDRPLTDFNLSVRTLNICKSVDIDTVRDLVKDGIIPFMQKRKFGMNQYYEIDEFLRTHNLSFGMDV